LSYEKRSSGVGAALNKSKSSGARAGAMFIKIRAPDPEHCHFYDGSAVLKKLKLKAFYP